MIINILLICFGVWIAYRILGKVSSSSNPKINNGLPKESDFPEGTRFLIKDWDIPLSTGSYKGNKALYTSWYGGIPHPHPSETLKIDNNWPADSYTHWLEIIEKSMNGS